MICKNFIEVSLVFKLLLCFTIIALTRPVEQLFEMDQDTKCVTDINLATRFRDGLKRLV